MSGRFPWFLGGLAMKTLRFAIPLGVVLLLGAGKAPKNDKELQKFQGTWVAVTVEINGNEEKEAVKGLVATVAGNKITIKHGKRSTEGTFTIDPSKKPKWLDSKAKVGDKEITTVGIYKFDGNKLIICHTHAGG
jgi:uncharacterized protein (TIGR03067 family)